MMTTTITNTTIAFAHCPTSSFIDIQFKLDTNVLRFVVGIVVVPERCAWK